MPPKERANTPKIPSGRSPQAVPVTSEEAIAPTPTSSSPLTEFKASSYFPLSFWEPSAHIPALDEATYKERLERVKGQ